MRLVFVSFFPLSISQTAAEDPFTCLTFNASCMPAAVKILQPSLQHLRIAPFIELTDAIAKILASCGWEKSYF